MPVEAVLAAWLLVWCLIGIIAFAPFKARKAPMLAAVPGRTWELGFAWAVPWRS